MNAGLTAPHAPGALLPQLKLQSTPSCEESPVTLALIVVACSALIAGDGTVTVTEIDEVEVMVAVAEAVTLKSAVAAAVIVTVPPVGRLVGAL